MQEMWGRLLEVWRPDALRLLRGARADVEDLHPAAARHGRAAPAGVHLEDPLGNVRALRLLDSSRDIKPKHLRA